MEEDVTSIVASVLSFLNTTSALKHELRHGWNPDGIRQESVADHCFQLSLAALLIAPYLEQKVNVERLLKICLVHDLAEAITGDTPYLSETDRLSKRDQEDSAMRQLTDPLPLATRTELYGLWLEYEEGITQEAKCARALDNLEAQLQHNIAPLDSWVEREYGFVYTKMDRWCEHDKALYAMCEMIKDEAEEKMVEGVKNRGSDL